MFVLPQQTEQRLLLLSASATFSLATAGVIVGLSTQARSIVFDGVFDLVDAAMTIAAWLAVRLIARATIGGG